MGNSRSKMNGYSPSSYSPRSHAGPRTGTCTSLRSPRSSTSSRVTDGTNVSFSVAYKTVCPTYLQ